MVGLVREGGKRLLLRRDELRPTVALRDEVRQFSGRLVLPDMEVAITLPMLNDILGSRKDRGILVTFEKTVEVRQRQPHLLGSTMRLCWKVNAKQARR